jgi:hypothetical protein
MSCHRKLGPAQSLFNGTPVSADHPLQFVYDDENGREQRFMITSYDDLVPKIQQQRAYKVCQVRKFWNWYVGNDVPLVGEKLNTMVAEYSNARSIPDLVSKIVNRPEVYTDPTEGANAMSMANFETVKPIFQHCNDCHRSHPLVASFTEMPFTLYGDGNVKAEHLDWLHQIADETAIFDGTRQPRMPPMRAGWHLERDEVQKMLLWYYGQARDSNGQPTITVAERDQFFAHASPQILAYVKKGVSREPHFGQTWRRYLEGRDFLRVLSQSFSGTGFDIETVVNGYGCGKIMDNNSAFGFVDRLTGKARSDQPTFGFLSIWSGCVSEVLNSVTTSYDVATTDKMAEAWGYKNTEDLIQAIHWKPGREWAYSSESEPAIFVGSFSGNPWNTLSPAVQSQLINGVIAKYIRAETLNNPEKYAYQINQTLFLADPNSQKSIQQTINAAILLILTSNEYLSF